MPHYHPNLTPSEDTDELLACLRLQKRLISCPVCGGGRLLKLFGRRNKGRMGGRVEESGSTTILLLARRFPLLMIQ